MLYIILDIDKSAKFKWNRGIETKNGVKFGLILPGPGS